MHYDPINSLPFKVFKVVRTVNVCSTYYGIAMSEYKGGSLWYL